MATPHAVALLNTARQGEKLSTADRRHVIAYLMTFGDVTKDTKTGDEYMAAPMSIAQMAELFQVSDRTVKSDKAAIREEMAKEVKAEDIALILADIRLTFTKVMLNIEKSAGKARLGSRGYLDHQLALARLQTDYVKSMQDLGIYPKELGTINVEKFEFSAQVGLQAAGRPLNLFDGRKPQPPMIEAHTVHEGIGLSDGEEDSTQPGSSTGSGEEPEISTLPDGGQAGIADPSSSS